MTNSIPDRSLKNGRATIKDVAQLAGVSIATVSRVISGQGVSRQKTVDAVMRAAAELGFRANRAGSELRSGTTRTIGVMLPTLHNPVFAECMNGIQCAARERGMSAILTTTSYQKEYEQEALDSLLSHRVAGLILIVGDADNNLALDMLDREGVPYVLVLNQPERRDRDIVTVDNVAAAVTATQALIAKGHRHIAMVAGRMAQSDRSKRRYEGFQKALAQAGLPEGQLIEMPFDTASDDGVIARALNQSNRPTGFFCSGDLLALRTISALKGLGLDVPQQASVIGFDGIEIGGLVCPPLTTIKQPSEFMGREAMRMLCDKTSHPGRPSGLREMIPHELLLRQTLGKAPK